MMDFKRNFLWVYFLIVFNWESEALENCATSNIKFEKILGLRPPQSHQALLLYQEQTRPKTPPHPITQTCLEKCHENQQCLSFVLYYNTSSCFWYQSSLQEVQSNGIPDPNTSWFIKTCLNHTTCSKSWVFDRIPGAILIGNDTKTLENPTTRQNCLQACLDERTFICRSIKFKLVKENLGFSQGVCTLSNADRHSLPNGYRVSTYEDEYLENLCALKDPNQNGFCAFEEFQNVVLSHNDVLFVNSTKEFCQEACEESKNISCRGFTLLPNDPPFGLTTDCLITSEDSKVFGPQLLKEFPHSIYYERASCLNISVKCSETYMTVIYNPNFNFNGRMYMKGYAEQHDCSVQGQGAHEEISLKLPLLSEQCGVGKALAPNNRTLLSGNLILQYNSLIQTQNDRLIRVGCIFGNDSKVLVGTGVTVSSHVPSKGSVLVDIKNNETNQPTVEMRVVDASTGEEISDTEIGQDLKLIIEVKPASTPYDLWASHLVAMTEHNEESIFLLDDRGCPTNLNVFPALEHVESNTTKALEATFQAFKFADSPIVRFSVLVQFCPKQCPAVVCGATRKRRFVTNTSIIPVNRTQFERSSRELPLEFVMIVHDGKFSDRLVLGEAKHKILVAGYDYSTNEVCIDYSFVIGLIVTWVIIQIIFVVCCIVLVRKYKSYYKEECSRQSMEELNKNFGIGFSNLENRRVHWADA